MINLERIWMNATEERMGGYKWFIVGMENDLDSSMIIFLFLELFYGFLYLMINDIM